MRGLKLLEADRRIDGARHLWNWRATSRVTHSLLHRQATDDATAGFLVRQVGELGHGQSAHMPLWSAAALSRNLLAIVHPILLMNGRVWRNGQYGGADQSDHEAIIDQVQCTHLMPVCAYRR